MSTDLDTLAARFAAAPYHADVGIRIDALEEGRARLRVPFKKENSNPGKALHGGVYASTINAAGALVATSVIPPGPEFETGTLALDVSYLAAAIGEDIVAEAHVLRRGKELVYVDVQIANPDGKALARGLTVYRIFDPATSPAATGRRMSLRAPADHGAVGSILEHGELIVSAPFMARRSMQIARMSDGHAVLGMPWKHENDDAAGNVHEGALAALVDTTGAMASWSITGLDLTYKASTVAIYVSYHAPLEREAAVASARTLTRNNEIFVNEVVVAGEQSGRVVATGTVLYRLVVPG